VARKQECVRVGEALAALLVLRHANWLRLLNARESARHCNWSRKADLIKPEQEQAVASAVFGEEDKLHVEGVSGNERRAAEMGRETNPADFWPSRARGLDAAALSSTRNCANVRRNGFRSATHLVAAYAREGREKGEGEMGLV
jgi:hypothetical protein